MILSPCFINQGDIMKGLLFALSLLLVTNVYAEPRVRPTEWAQPVLGVELGNFYKVSDELYRSQQPDDDVMPQLEAMGIHSVLDLREFHSDNGKAKGTVLKLYRVPMNAGEIDDALVEKALDVIATAPKPVLVHCWHGSDRTGVIVAMYRMVFQDWPRERAIDEFLNGGYGYHKSFYTNIERYLETVDISHFKQRLVQHSK